MQDTERKTTEDRPSPRHRPAYAGTNWLNLIIDAAIAWWSGASKAAKCRTTGERP